MELRDCELLLVARAISGARTDIFIAFVARVPEPRPYIKRDKFRLATVRPHAKLKVALRDADYYDNSLGTATSVSHRRTPASYFRVRVPNSFSPRFLKKYSQTRRGNCRAEMEKGKREPDERARSLVCSFVSFSVKSAESSTPEAHRTSVFINDLGETSRRLN